MRGQATREAEALERLEQLPAPHIVASGAEARTSVTVFVPPNDPRSDRQKNARGVLPAFRSRQPRRFPAARPHHPVVRLVWDGVNLEESVLAALQRLANDTAYVGHSASLTRCRFTIDHQVAGDGEVKVSQRRIYPGRFAELRQAFDMGQRPLPGARVGAISAPRGQRTNVFGERWLLLEHVGGEMPDLRACALVAKTMRDALLAGYERIGSGNRIPEVVSGHGTDGNPTRVPHLAVVPLPFVGFPYADGHVMGFALVPPHASSILDDENFRKALRNLAPLDEQGVRRILTLKPKQTERSGASFSIDLAPTFDPPSDARSLNPALYTGPARSFATVTPIALDRHLREKGEERQREIREQIASACRNIGLPEPEMIVADKHSAIQGAPSAQPSEGSPPWMRWRMPQSLASRQLTHAVIRFAVPVDGPVILGAGRFMGLGLCRCLEPERR
jgi:CRISPR-associated protein Csb2